MSTDFSLWLGLIVFCAMALESITGFGATILALPFLGMIIGVSDAVALMSMLSLLFGLYVFCIQRKYIDKTVLFHILLCSGFGMPVGIIAFSVLPERWLKLIMGLFITFSAVRALLSQSKDASVKTPAPCRKLSAKDCFLLFVGGIFHGAFASGGPLITLYVSGQIHDKRAFRATMTFVWVVFNTLLLIKNLCIGGIVTPPFVKTWLLCIPFLIAGAFLGGRLHRKVPLAFFTLLTNILLLAAGISTLLTQLQIF